VRLRRVLEGLIKDGLADQSMVFSERDKLKSWRFFEAFDEFFAFIPDVRRRGFDRVCR
jgi:hypothetical protein